MLVITLDTFFFSALSVGFLLFLVVLNPSANSLCFLCDQTKASNLPRLLNDAPTAGRRKLSITDIMSLNGIFMVV